MKIEALTKQDQLTLCRAAERVCGTRLRSLRSYADPQDKPLLKVLDERLEDWRMQLHSLELLDPVGRGTLREEDAARVVRERFPSLRNGFGEGYVTREVALYLAECVEDERSRFYHDMSAAARDAEARVLFQQLADRDEAHLRFLRTVLL